MPVIPVSLATPKSSRQFAGSLIPVAAVSLFTFLVCYFRSFVFPDISIVLWGDHLGFFYDGSRIVGGQLPYRDYFQIVPPGTELTYALLIKCFGLSAWIPNLMMACLAAAMAWMITLAARRFMAGNTSLLPALLFAGFILHGGLDPTHHWFSTVAVMAAMLVLLDDTSLPRVAAAGALCGLAACFTQTKGAGALVAFIAYFIWKSRQDGASAWWRKVLLLCVAAAVVFFAANAYFIAAAGLRQWLFCIIVYPLRYYPTPAVNNWRVLLYDFKWHTGHGRWIAYPFVYATVPLVYFVFLFTMRRQRKKQQNIPWDQLLLVCLTGLGMFLAIASAPSLKRMSAVGAPAMILLVWLLNQSNQAGVRLKIILALATIAFAIEAPLRAQTRWKGYLDLPAGRMALNDPALYEEYAWALAHTHPGQFFFGMPPLYTPFHLVNPAAVDTFETTEYTRPEQIAEQVQALKTHAVPLLILRNSKEFLQATPSPSNHSASLRAYILENYRLVRSFATGDEVWEKI
jgi:hypothetical protein